MKPLNDFKVLVTAEEAFPAFERAVLSAQNRIDLGFRVFDPRTRLVSEEARGKGDTWIDLLAFKLAQGVPVSMVLTDFDPVVRAKMHYNSWKSLRIFYGIGEISGRPDLLQARVADHPARVGWAPRLILWPKVMSQIADTCDWVDSFEPDARRDILHSMPRFAEMVTDRDGKLAPVKKQVPPMMPATHHQKLAVIDDETLYIGGLDVDQRRFDTQKHPGRASLTWHDVHAMVREPDLALEARTHLDRFMDEAAGCVSVQPPKSLLRTLSVRRSVEGGSLSPTVCDTGIQDRHLALIGKAEHLIYLESQFCRDPVIAEALAKRAAEAPDLGLIIMLPAAPQEIAFENEEGLDYQYGEYLQGKFMQTIQDAFGERLFIGSPAQLKCAEGDDRGVLYGAPMVFIHSKVSIFDDKSALITSANLNGRSMRWDTELGIEIAHPEQVADVRDKVLRAWLPDDPEAACLAPRLEAVACWRALARENAATAPESRRGFILPHDPEAARAFGSPLPGVPVEMV